MKKQGKLLAPLAAVLLGATLPAAAAPTSGSDEAFNAMVLEMSGQDTGSAWFDYYVETLNQHIAYKSADEAFGAAGPSGPLAGFDGYVAGFVDPDTGSKWFNAYVDNLRRVLRAKEAHER
ncbi:hypothetical protein [Azospira restricta]|uniref:Lipoprotein n=1 Tax=Azospira restricta TaxID=404405 RepID=A0A974PWX0_9RHOO|nr:hypothetical protein [Azospira restricta]QRJ62734.1 hypothetical protein IWH25_13270 [Azospira restricta]